MPVDFQDYHQTLGVSKDAPQDKIILNLSQEVERLREELNFLRKI